MVTKALLTLCAQALLAKFTLGQCLGSVALGAPHTTRLCEGGAPIERFCYGNRIGYGGFYGLSPSSIGLNPSFGGSFMVTSSSPIAPTGLRVYSENAIKGTLSVIGNLPFLGAVVTDGAFSSTGTGAVSYGCGDGCIGITAENINASPAIAPPIVPGLGFTVAPSGLPYGRGFPFSYRGRCGVY